MTTPENNFGEQQLAGPRGRPAEQGRQVPARGAHPDEVAAIIGQCSPKAPTGIRNRALLMLLYWSGLRVAELTALGARRRQRPAALPFGLLQPPRRP